MLLLPVLYRPTCNSPYLELIIRCGVHLYRGTFFLLFRIDLGLGLGADEHHLAKALDLLEAPAVEQFVVREARGQQLDHSAKMGLAR